MATTPEGRTKALITAYLKSLAPDCWYHMPIGGAYSSAGVPDYVGTYLGRSFAIEAKKPGGKPSALQVLCMEKINAAGGFALIVDGPISLAVFKAWVDAVKTS